MFNFKKAALLAATIALVVSSVDAAARSRSPMRSGTGSSALDRSTLDRRLNKACADGNIAKIESALRKGAKPYWFDMCGRTAFDLYVDLNCENGYQDVKELEEGTAPKAVQEVYNLFKQYAEGRTFFTNHNPGYGLRKFEVDPNRSPEEIARLKALYPSNTFPMTPDKPVYPRDLYAGKSDAEIQEINNMYDTTRGAEDGHPALDNR